MDSKRNKPKQTSDSNGVVGAIAVVGAAVLGGVIGFFGSKLLSDQEKVEP